MIKTLKEIQALINGGEITAITLDTSIFDAQQRGLEHGLLKRLSQFKDSDNILLLSDVVLREIESHLRIDVEEALTAVRRAKSLISRSWQQGSAKAFENGAQTVLLTDAASIVKSRLDSFCAVSGIVEIKAGEYARCSDVINWYFASEPPFGANESKKHEFPDAFALSSLELWAQKSNTHILVVTLDGDWTSYCTASPSLIPINNLSVALGCFQKESARYACQTLIELHNGGGDQLGLKAKLLSALNDQAVEVIDLHVEAFSQFDFNEDIVEMTFSDFELLTDDDSAVEPVDYDENYVVMSLRIEAFVEIKCHFGFEKWDSIDRDYVPMGAGVALANEKLTLQVLVTLTGDIPKKMKIDSLEILPSRLYLDVGEIQPAWMNDPSSFD